MSALVAFESSIDRSNRLLDLHKKLTADGTSTAEDRGNVLRATVVLAAAAFETFFHARFSESLAPFIKQNGGPGKDLGDYLSKCGVTTEFAVSLFHNKRPLATLRKKVDSKLYQASLQNLDSLTKLFRCYGFPDILESVAGELGLQKNTVVGRLNKLLERRNHISHEGDLFRGKKKKHASRPIALTEVETMVREVSEIVEASEKVLARQVRISQKKKGPKVSLVVDPAAAPVSAEEDPTHLV